MHLESAKIYSICNIFCKIGNRSWHLQKEVSGFCIFINLINNSQLSTVSTFIPSIQHYKPCRYYLIFFISKLPMYPVKYVAY